MEWQIMGKASSCASFAQDKYWQRCYQDSDANYAEHADLSNDDV